MKKLFFLLLISFGSFAQKDTTITRRKVVVINKNYYIEQTTTSVTYQLFNISMIEGIDKKDDEEIEIRRQVQERNKQLSEKNIEKREFQKHLRDAIRQGYVPEITNSREQEIYQ
jgi:hypothetical protein